MAGIRRFANTRTITPSPAEAAPPLSNEQLEEAVINLQDSIDTLESSVQANGVVQAGTVTASSYSGTVTFPVAFASAPVVTVSPRYSPTSGPYSPPAVNAVTSTGFTWGNMSTRNGTGGAEGLGIHPGLTWIAKGS